MFKLKRIFCLVALLSFFIPANVIHAGFGNYKIKVEGSDGSEGFTSVYKGPIAEDQNEAYKEFLKRYLDLKKRRQLIVDIPAGERLRDSMIKRGATIGAYREAILKQFETSGNVIGGCSEISTFISKILTDVGIENYLLYIHELDPKNKDQSKHTANLISLNEEWFVIDATLELQWRKENSFCCLNIPLFEYANYLKGALRFSSPHVGIQAISSEDKTNNGLAIPLEEFLRINGIYRLMKSQDFTSD